MDKPAVVSISTALAVRARNGGVKTLSFTGIVIFTSIIHLTLEAIAAFDIILSYVDGRRIWGGFIRGRVT